VGSKHSITHLPTTEGAISAYDMAYASRRHPESSLSEQPSRIHSPHQVSTFVSFDDSRFPLFAVYESVLFSAGLSRYFRRASILPCSLFGGSNGHPPPQYLQESLTKFMNSLTQLCEITVPFSPYTPTARKIELLQSLKILRISHVRPSIAVLSMLADACPGLTQLWFIMYGYKVSISPLMTSI